jgi:sec-independent protein translocase protein TatA
MPSIGPAEIIIVLVIVLLIFGPKRLPDLGRSLGRGMREFKDSVTGKDGGDEKHLEERNVEQAAPVTPPTPVATTADEEARARAQAAGHADPS